MRRLAFICLLLCGFGALAQAPAPSPSERELQQPLALDDGKPTQGQEAPGAPSTWRAFGSTLLVVGLAGGALWALRKYGVKKLPGSGGTRLKVEETLAMGERRFVSILRADDEQFLIGLTPQGITLLARLDGLGDTAPGDFNKALEHQVEMTRPMPVKDMEALIKGDHP